MSRDTVRSCGQVVRCIVFHFYISISVFRLIRWFRLLRPSRFAQDTGSTPFRSISKKYMADLETLLRTLSTCSLHYIRCFKPNEVQEPNIFNKSMVLDQIIQCGTIELVKIMHDGSQLVMSHRHGHVFFFPCDSLGTEVTRTGAPSTRFLLDSRHFSLKTFNGMVCGPLSRSLGDVCVVFVRFACPFEHHQK